MLPRGGAALVLGIGLGVAACATVIPPTPPPPPSDYYVQAPYDTTWQRVIAFFADNRVPIQTIDKSSGLIVSSHFTLPSERVQQWVDCGKASTGESTVSKLQAMGNPPTVIADFNVFLRPAEDSTSVRVNLGLTATALSPGGVVSLSCVTNGQFESELIHRISRNGA